MKPFWNETFNDLTKTLPWPNDPSNLEGPICIVRSSENTRVMRMRKIKINPTKAQKLMLNKFAGPARFTYNACVAAVNDKTHKNNKFVLRNAFVTAKNNDFFENKQWLLSTPKVIRQQAVFEAVKNFKSAFSNLRNKNIDKFKVRFKTLRHQRENGYVLGIEKAVKFKDGILTILPETIGNVRFFEKPPIVQVPEAECSIQRDKYGDFWLQVPVYKSIKPSCCAPAVAIDPGVRTPMSFYSPNGNSGLLGLDMKKRIDDIKGRVATIDRRISKADDALRKKLLWHRRRLFRKYTHVRDDCHWKLINDLTNEYGGVILPHLQTSRLCGMLKSKTNREMFGISHFILKERMSQKCEEKGIMFASPTEEYTSKTCGNCGMLNHKLGSSETFRCPCGLVCHRDLHAARNIYMKWFKETERGARALEAFDPLLAS
jgi:transposase